MDSVAEIKSRLPIDQLVGRYVKLKRAGRYFKGLCPFHQERTPSFVVSPDKELAYCFGCRKGGDHFSFIQQVEGLEFRDALKFLAEIAGVRLPEEKFDRVAGEQTATKRERIYQINEAAAGFFESMLTGELGSAARSYCTERGLHANTMMRARMGYAPGNGQLLGYLLNKGFTRDELTECGLFFVKETSDQQLRDRFRNRLMFPIRDHALRICGFGGRALAADDEPKYLNSPETPVFKKSEILYGYGEAREAIRQKRHAILVEGYMDVLAVRQAGIEHAVATCGTACTEEHLRVLKRTTDYLILSFDQDAAGRQAAKRTLEMGLHVEIPMRVAVWTSSAKDPDECMRSNPDAFQEALENARSPHTFLIDHCLNSIQTTTSEGRKQLFAELMPTLLSIQSAVELDQWVGEVSRAFTLNPSSLYDEIKRSKGRQQRPIREETSQPPTPYHGMSESEYLLGLMLTYRELRSIANQFLGPEDFLDGGHHSIYRSLFDQYNHALEESASAKAEMLTLFVESMNAGLGWEDVVQEFKSVLRRFVRERFMRQKRTLVARLKDAETVERDKLLSQISSLHEQESNLITKL